MSREIEESIAKVLAKNVNLFVRLTLEMSRINPKFHYYRLAICLQARPVAQRKRKLDPEKAKTMDK